MPQSIKPKPNSSICCRRKDTSGCAARGGHAAVPQQAAPTAGKSWPEQEGKHRGSQQPAWQRSAVRSFLEQEENGSGLGTGLRGRAGGLHKSASDAPRQLVICSGFPLPQSSSVRAAGLGNPRAAAPAAPQPWWGNPAELPTRTPAAVANPGGHLPRGHEHPPAAGGAPCPHQPCANPPAALSPD